MARLRILLPLLVASGCACGPVAEIDAGADAGVDAPDSPRDGGLDAPRDARDGGLDGGPSDPGWVTIDGYPPECALAYATYPERLFVATWEPCEPASLVSCTWLPRDDRFPDREFWAETTRFHDGTRGYFAGAVSLGPRSDLRRAVFVAPTDGPALFAIREWLVPQPDGSFCLVGRPGMTGAGVAVRALRFTEPATRHRSMFHAPLSDVRALLDTPRPFDTSLVPGANSDQQLVATATTRAFVVQPIGHVVIQEGSASVIRGGPTGVVRGEPDTLTLHGRDAFWMSWYEGAGGDEVWLVHASMDEVEEVLVRVPGTKLWGLAVADDEICWQVETSRTPEGRPDRGDLYCSPYATDAASIAPRLVRGNVPLDIGAALALGRYAIVEWDRTEFFHTLFIVDTATGELRELLSPASWRLGSPPLWVTDTEVAVPMAAPFDSVVRIGLDAFTVVP